ncbi:MAG: hypothetical protein H6745_30780 [Deltaproteobacteria bacterium]|nr:hypothetical protein [Deltaproteobacteria bacterium]
MRTTAYAAVAALAAIVLTASSTALAAFPHGPARVVVDFDPQAGEAPESIVFDLAGNAYVSLSLTGEIRKIAPDGTQTTLAVLPLGQAPPGALFPGIMGALAIRIDGTLFVSLASADLDAKGIWKVSPSGAATQLAHLPAGALPNGIALRLGQLYVADAALGVVWRVPVTGGTPVAWIDDPVLDVQPNPIELAPGANGIQFFGDTAFVCNSSAGTIYRFAMDRHGNAGPPVVHATGVPCDDFAFDIVGNIYATTDPFNVLVLVRPNGTQETLLTAADGLDGPTSAAFGRTLGDLRTLYVTNAAFPFFSTTFSPKIIAVQLPFPGAPRWWL